MGQRASAANERGSVHSPPHGSPPLPTAAHQLNLARAKVQQIAVVGETRTEELRPE
jgi:hypothetical protein